MLQHLMGSGSSNDLGGQGVTGAVDCWAKALWWRYSFCPRRRW